jgi:hypothetical protein
MMAITFLMAAMAFPILCAAPQATAPRERISINEGWRFTKDDPPGNTESLAYENIKQWILPTGNPLIADPSRRFARPDGKSPGESLAYVQSDFDDSSWRRLDLPHDWGVEGPFLSAGNLIQFEISGPGEIVATDNGDPTDLTLFTSAARKAFNGLALVIVRAQRGQPGQIKIAAKSEGLPATVATITAK